MHTEWVGILQVALNHSDHNGIASAFRQRNLLDLSKELPKHPVPCPPLVSLLPNTT